MKEVEMLSKPEAATSANIPNSADATHASNSQKFGDAASDRQTAPPLSRTSSTSTVTGQLTPDSEQEAATIMENQAFTALTKGALVQITENRDVVEPVRYWQRWWWCYREMKRWP